MNASDKKSNTKEGKEGNEAFMKLRFQNYNPRTEDLKKYCEEGPDPEEILKQITESQEELIKSTNRKFGDPSLDLDNVVPRKANWDIERSLTPKLERLEKRTQRAILQIVQRKVAEEQEGALEQPDLSSDDE